MIRLVAVAPQEICLRVFYQSIVKVTELGFHILNPAILQNLFAIEDVVFIDCMSAPPYLYRSSAHRLCL